MTTIPALASPLRRILVVDAVFELGVAAVLLSAPHTAGSWLAIGTAGSLAAGIVFLAAAIGIAFVARAAAPAPGVVRILARANVAGGIAAWIAFVLLWGQFAPAGRALLGSTADCLLVIGALELHALRPRR